MTDAMSPFFEATVRTATPLAFAAIGELVAERSGVINIGLEGTIIAGAFGGLVVAGTGGAGVQQAFMVKVFAASATGATVAAYSVGQQIAIAVACLGIGACRRPLCGQFARQVGDLLRRSEVAHRQLQRQHGHNPCRDRNWQCPSCGSIPTPLRATRRHSVNRHVDVMATHPHCS